MAIIKTTTMKCLTESPAVHSLPSLHHLVFFSRLVFNMALSIHAYALVNNHTSFTTDLLKPITSKEIR